MSVGVVYLEPIYDPQYKTYHKILTMGQMPSMPLAQYVRKINTPILSSLNNQNGNKSRCIYAILKTLDEDHNIYYDSDTPYMEAEDIPRLFGYLVSNGYTIESGWTNVLQNSNVSFTNKNDNNRTLMFVLRQS